MPPCHTLRGPSAPHASPLYTSTFLCSVSQYRHDYSRSYPISIIIRYAVRQSAFASFDDLHKTRQASRVAHPSSIKPRLRLMSLSPTTFCCAHSPLDRGQALREEPDNAKALYRRAVVYCLRDQFK